MNTMSGEREFRKRTLWVW